MEKTFLFQMLILARYQAGEPPCLGDPPEILVREASAVAAPDFAKLTEVQTLDLRYSRPPPPLETALPQTNFGKLSRAFESVEDTTFFVRPGVQSAVHGPFRD